MQKEQIKEIYGFNDKDLSIYELGIAKGKMEGVYEAVKIFEKNHEDEVSKYYRGQVIEASKIPVRDGVAFEKRILQRFYEKMIEMANFCYSQSQSPKYTGIQEALTGKAEAYEATAEYFASTFPAHVKTVYTLRQVVIEEMYKEEFSNEHKILEDVTD